MRRLRAELLAMAQVFRHRTPALGRAGADLPLARIAFARANELCPSAWHGITSLSEKGTGVVNTHVKHLKQ